MHVLSQIGILMFVLYHSVCILGLKNFKKLFISENSRNVYNIYAAIAAGKTISMIFPSASPSQDEKKSKLEMSISIINYFWQPNIQGGIFTDIVFRNMKITCCMSPADQQHRNAFCYMTTISGKSIRT